MPLTECRCSKPLIYHKQGKGEALRHSQAKIEREREWEWDRSAENEIKRREKSTYRKTEGKREIMLKYREQTERFSRENMEALAWGNAINEKLKKKPSQTWEGGDWSVGLNVTIFMSEGVGEGNCLWQVDFAEFSSFVLLCFFQQQESWKKGHWAFTLGGMQVFRVFLRYVRRQIKIFSDLIYTEKYPLDEYTIYHLHMKAKDNLFRSLALNVAVMSISRHTETDWKKGWTCRFKVGKLIKRGEAVTDRGNYFTVIVNHEPRAWVNSNKKAKPKCCSVANFTFFTPSPRLVAIWINVVREENEEGGRGGWRVTGNRRV